MPSRRLIREKALLSLFSFPVREEGDVETHWELILEPENKEILKVSVKTLTHQLQSLEKWKTRLSETAPACATLLKSYEEKTLARDLLSLVKKTETLTLELNLILKLPATVLLRDFYTHASSVESLTAAFLTEHAATTYTSPEKDKLTECIQKLKGLWERIPPLAQPLNFPEAPSTASLRKLTRERDLLREEASLLAQGTRDHLLSLDEQLSTHLENFSTEQLGRVEFNILRMAAYEILILEKPKAVIINESLELAKKFASDDAVALINGVLDQLS